MDTYDKVAIRKVIVMSNEEIIEEILMEAHGYGVRKEVIKKAKELMQEDPKMSKVDAYEIALEECTK